MRTTIIVIVLIIAGALLTWMMISSPDDGISGDVVTHPSGLKYVDVKVGSGREAKPGATVIVHYTGKLKNGTKFDSSLDRKEPFDFKLGAGEVIKGWDIGVAGMKEGGVRTLIIPGDLGYGARGSPPKIPPNATLIFDVQLLKVE